VPTLEQVIELGRDQIRFNIEIKEDGLENLGVAEELGRYIARSGISADVIVSSFSPLALARLARITRPPLGLCYPMDDGEGLRGRLRDRLFREPWTVPLLAAYALHPNHRIVTPELVRKAHGRGLAVNTWTVNDEPRMRQLAAWRVTGLITDRPDLALRVTRELDPLQRPGSGMPA
jgi:glycerophosphoryl diester phosphodiesterase